MKAGPLITVRAEDYLQQLASLIKQRESSLLLLIEEKSQRHWERAQWLLRECHYQSKENRVSR